MNDRDHDLPPEMEAEWRDWASTEPSIDERQLRRNLLEKIPDRRFQPRTRLVLVAAAASVLLTIIGIESIRRPPAMVVADEALVHETGANVILVLREGNEPIYIATEASNGEMGEQR